MSTRYYYRDFITGERHFTRAPFIGWTEPTGLMNVRYAIFGRQSEDLLIPVYLLDKQTKALLPLPDEHGLLLGQTVEVLEDTPMSERFSLKAGLQGDIIEVAPDKVRVRWQDDDVIWISPHLIRRIEQECS